MPNWSTNHLDITGVENVRLFREKVMPKGGPLTFKHLMPIPTKINRCSCIFNSIYDTNVEKPELHDPMFYCTDGYYDTATSRYLVWSGYATKNSDWYNWCVENWGTKWDACEPTTVCDEADCLSFEFDTAWSPPSGFYAKLAEVGIEFVAEFAIEGGLGSGIFTSSRDDDGIVRLGEEFLPDDDMSLYQSLRGEGFPEEDDDEI